MFYKNKPSAILLDIQDLTGYKRKHHMMIGKKGKLYYIPSCRLCGFFCYETISAIRLSTIRCMKERDDKLYLITQNSRYIFKILNKE